MEPKLNLDIFMLGLLSLSLSNAVVTFNSYSYIYIKQPQKPCGTNASLKLSSHSLVHNKSLQNFAVTSFNQQKKCYSHSGTNIDLQHYIIILRLNWNQ